MTADASAAQARPLSFDVVIATRNRPEALALSIPLILGQSRLPGKLIVIDSSDDHAPAARAVAQAVARATQAGETAATEVIVEHAEPSSARQRNRGLEHVTADVTIFPDDDSLFHDGVSAEIMKVYERDADRLIAGVCTSDAPDPPPGVLPESAYAMTSAQKRERRGMRLRNRLEKRMTALHPFLYMGGLITARAVARMPAELRDWMAREDVVPVELMTGFRMSFRSDCIRAFGFDAAFSGYALGEDVDASFAMAPMGALVGARKARIHHHKHPGRRDNGYAMGAKSVINRAYVIAKHIHDAGLTGAEAATARDRMRSYARLKMLAALASARSTYGRDQLRGARAAYREIAGLFAAPRETLADRFAQALARIGDRGPGGGGR